MLIKRKYWEQRRIMKAANDILIFIRLWPWTFSCLALPGLDSLATKYLLLAATSSSTNGWRCKKHLKLANKSYCSLEKVESSSLCFEILSLETVVNLINSWQQNKLRKRREHKGEGYSSCPEFNYCWSYQYEAAVKLFPAQI